MLKSVTIDTKAKTITAVMDLEEPRPSSSGKTMLIGGTGGTATSNAQHEGKPVKVTASVFIPR